MSDEAVKEIEGLLQAEVEKERASNGLAMKIGGGFGLFVAGYLLWVSWAVGTLVDPAGLAQAASGFAIGAVPEAGKQVRALVVDGAPELVRMGSDQILGMLPGYRLALQEEIDPVLEEVCLVLANTAVKELSEHAGDPAATYSGDQAMQAAADAAVARVDATLSDAMDLPDEDGVTPRQSIDKSLTQLKKIDAQLKIIAKKGGDPQERELLVAWLGVVAQSNEAEEVALMEDHKATAAEAQKKEDAAAPAPAIATVPAGDAPTVPEPGK